jgi:Tol biopolymer transport system component
MALAHGTRLGPYEITAAIGAGGMGEVYRARDTRLLRDVAIKVLPAAVARDADRLRRFEQEARATAALNHPNILAVYDVGRDGDVAFLVEELLEGGTLRDALTAALPVRKVVDYAIQVANGLAAAHDKGIIHRDLKPENVFITRDDRVKVFDFGLAKTLAPTAAATSTALAGATEPGVVLGTVGYMAPEQVRGQAVDHRADIFSLGAVLYEMLTGARAFSGDTTADTISALLKDAPADPAESGRPIAPALARIVWRCLEKSPARRFQSATDLAFALQSISLDTTTGSGAAIVAARPRPAWVIPVATALAGLAIGGLAVWWLRGPAAISTGAPVRFSLSATDGLGIDDLTRAAVSPNGRYIAIGEAVAGDRQLTVVSIAGGIRKALGTVGIGSFCWSPDGAWLAYFGADRALYKVAFDTLQRQRLASLDWSPSSVSWSVTGDIFLTSTVSSAVVVVPSGGGASRQILAVQPDTPAWASVQALRDGRRLLLSRGTGSGAQILLAAADGSQPPEVIAEGAFAQFVQPDLLLALRDNQIVAWRTDLGGGRVAGQPSVVADGVLVRLGVAMMSFAVSEGGLLVYRAEQHESRTRMAWFDRAGREGAALVLTAHCRNPELSPRFDLVAVECWHPTGGRDIWVYDFARDAATRLTTDPADDADPLWTPDGRTIIFASSRRGSVDVYRTTVGGGRTEELVVETLGSTPTMGLSPDGRHLMVLATALEPGSGLDLASYTLAGSAEMTPVLKSPSAEIEGQFSPDGRFFLFGSNHSGRFDVYVEPWPQTGERWSVSTEGGTDARWSPDGREIFYLAPDRRLMAVPVRTTPAFSAGRPVVLFQTRVAGPLGLGHRFPFAIAKDGERFLMYVSDPHGPPPALSVVANWPALVGAR